MHAHMSVPMPALSKVKILTQNSINHFTELDYEFDLQGQGNILYLLIVYVCVHVKTSAL